MCNISATFFGLFITLGVLTGSMGGCASKPVPGDWIGASFTELEAGFGPPEAVMINPRDNRVYVFREHRRSDDAPTKLTYGQGELVLEGAECAVMFELEGEVVTRWSWFEAGCREFVLPPRLPQGTKAGGGA